MEELTLYEDKLAYFHKKRKRYIQPYLVAYKPKLRI